MITHCHRCKNPVKLSSDGHRIRCETKLCSGHSSAVSLDIFYIKNEPVSYWFVFDNLIYVASTKTYRTYYEIGKLIDRDPNSGDFFKSIIHGDYYLEFDDTFELEKRVNKILNMKAFW